MVGAKKSAVDTEYYTQASKCVLVIDSSKGRNNVVGYYLSKVRNSTFFPLREYP